MKRIILIALILSASLVTKAQTARFEKVSISVDLEKEISDTLYSAKIFVTFSDTKGIVPNFYKDTTVVSTNFLTGFQVDAQREQAINELVGRVND